MYTYIPTRPSAPLASTSSAKFLLDKILRLRQRQERLMSIHWIQAHIRIPGNEIEAKSAAKSVRSNIPPNEISMNVNLH